MGSLHPAHEPLTQSRSCLLLEEGAAFFLLIFFKKYIYLFILAAPGLSFGTRDL